MAIKLPRYQRQVGASSGAGAMQTIDPNAALAPVRAMGKAIDLATDMGAKFATTLKKHKDEGDLAGEKKRVDEWEAGLELEKKQARMNGVTDEQMMEDVIVPSMDRFTAEQADMGYSKTVKNIADANWGHTVQKVYAKEQGEIVQNAIIKGNIQKVELASSLEAQGKFDEADEVWDSARSTSKPGWVDERKSVSRYNLVNTEMQILLERRIDEDISDEEYFDGLNEMRDKVQNSDMKSNHKKTLESSVNAKILNYKGKRVTARDKSLKEFQKLRESDDITVEAIEVIEKTAGPEWANAIESTVLSSLSTEATTDADADKILNSYKDYKDGNISAGKALLRIGKVRGQYAEMGVYLIGAVARDQAENNGSVVAYDNNWNGVPSPVTSTTTDFVDNLSFFMGHQESGDRARYFSDTFRKYDKWREGYPDATKEDYIQFRNETFKQDADSFVYGTKAPQQKTSKANEVKRVVQGKIAIYNADTKEFIRWE